MRSSIFSFEHVRRYVALSRVEKRWHAWVAGTLVLCALVASQVPPAVFGPVGCSGETLGSAAVASLSNQTEVLFLGSSHVLFGIRPQRYSSRSVSLAATWLDYSSMRSVVDKHLPSVPNLKVAVIEYDELPLVSDLVPAILGARDPRPLKDLSLSAFDFPTTGWRQRLQAVWTQWTYPLTGLPRLTPQGWAERAQSCSPLYQPPRGFAPGYYYTEGVTPPTFDPQPVFDALRTAAQNEDVVQRNLHSLQQMVTTLQRRGVTVVLLRLPHDREYVRLRPAAVTARWHQLQDWAQAERDLVVIDWGERSDFQPGDFVDIHHLNASGADKLASLLDAHLRSLCVTRR